MTLKVTVRLHTLPFFPSLIVGMHLTLVFGICLEKSHIFVSTYKIKTLLCFKDVCF